MSSAGMPTTRLLPLPVRREYRVMTLSVEGFFGPNVDLDSLGSYLNDAGDEGWERVTVANINRGQGTTTKLLAIMKRPNIGS